MKNEEFDIQFAQALEQSLPPFSPQVKARALEAVARCRPVRARLRRIAMVIAASAAVAVLAIGTAVLWQRPRNAVFSLVPHLAGKHALVAVVAAQHSVTDEKGRLLKQGDRLPGGATVRTDTRGRVTLFTRHGSEFTLNANTELALSRTIAVATVKKGEVYCRNRQGEIKRIKTPAGSVQLLGTVVDVKVRDRATSVVTVVKGRVRLENAHGQGLVRAGQRSMLVASLPPENGKPVSALAAIAWYDGRGVVVSDFREIAYVVRRGRSGFTEIWAMNADGTNKHRLKTYLGFVPASSVTWVPGGRRVTIKRSGAAAPLPPEQQGRKARFCVPSGSPSPHEVELVIDIATGQDTPFGLPPEYDFVDVLCPPTGTWVAVSAVYRPAVASGPQDECGTWLYDTDTGAIRKVLDWHNVGGMAWAPDSRRLAISVYGGRPNEPVYEGLVILDTKSGDILDLHTAGTGPSFSPDGTKLAYAYDGNARLDEKLRGSIFVTDLMTGGKPRLVAPPNRTYPNHTYRTAWPRWSPDGTLIGYVTVDHREGAPHTDSTGMWPRWSVTFYVAHANGSGVRRIYRFEGYLSAWSWSPSGDAIYAVTAEGVLLIATDGSGLRANLGGSAEDSVLSGEQRAQTEAALTGLTDALSKYAFGGLRAYEGRIAESQRAYRAAADAFAELMWKYPLADLSEDEVLAYADMAAELAARPRDAVLSLECWHRLDPLAHLLLWYGAEHQRFPPDLATLQDWSISKGEDVEWCRMVFRCPAGDETGPSIPYVYNVKATTGKLALGDTIISCPKHPERSIKWDHDFFMTLGEVAGGGHDLLRKFGQVP